MAAFVVGLASTPHASLAAAVAERASALAQLRSEQRAAEASYVAREAECKQRFVVSACIADAKRERRVVLDALRERQLTIDEAARRERATSRRAELAAKATEDLRRDAARAAKSISSASASSAVASPAPAITSSATESPSTAPSAAAYAKAAGHSTSALYKPAKPARSASAAGESRAERELAKREAFEDRRDSAARHRDDVVRRNAAQKGGPKPPLPAPSQAAISKPRAALPAAASTPR